ncbi:ankyrin [Thozetella sp. PMI_491]|nr:ankyrin [Thozetella sp. PMI_491]
MADLLLDYWVAAGEDEFVARAFWKLVAFTSWGDIEALKAALARPIGDESNSSDPIAPVSRIHPDHKSTKIGHLLDYAPNLEVYRYLYQVVLQCSADDEHLPEYKLRRGLKRSAKQGDIAMVKTILELGHLSPSDGLVAACEGGHLAMVDFLLNQGADPDTSGDSLSLPPIVLATWKGNVPIVRKLLDRGTNLNDDFPLRAALYAENEPLFRMLVDRGVVVDEPSGKSAMKMCVASGLDSMIELLWIDPIVYITTQDAEMIVRASSFSSLGSAKQGEPVPPAKPVRGVSLLLLDPPLSRGPKTISRRAPTSLFTPSQVPSLPSEPLEPTLQIQQLAVAAWRSEIEAIATAEEQAVFFEEVKNVRSLVDWVQQLEIVVKHEGQQSKSLKVVRWIKPVFQTMNLIAPVIVDNSPLDPRITGVFLGSIAHVLAISKKADDFQKGVELTLENMVTKLDFLNDYGENIFPRDFKLRRSLIALYSVILKFTVAVSRFFVNDKGKKKLAIKRIAYPAWQDFQQSYGDVQAEFDQRLADFTLAVNACRDREINRLVQEQVAITRRQDDQTSLGEEIFEAVTRIDETVQRIEQKVDDNEKVQQEREQRQLLQKRLDDIRKKRHRILEKLPTASFRGIQEDRFPSLVEGTGKWLTEHDEFTDWRDSADSSMLWVQGKAGSGKSCLACRVIEDLCIERELQKGSAVSNWDLVAVAYVYCSSTRNVNVVDSHQGDPQDPRKMKVTDPRILLGSILKQLLEQVPTFEEIPEIDKVFASNDVPTVDDIRRGIEIIARRFSRTFVVFDGLDECLYGVGSERRVFKELCDFLASLSDLRGSPQRQPSVKVLVFSRPGYPEIEAAFRWSEQITIDGQYNQSDIRCYTLGMLQGLKVIENDEARASVADQLLRRADGMFLWVDLVIKNLQDSGSEFEALEMLQELPADLNGLYLASLKRVLRHPSANVRKRAVAAIVWTLYAVNPISRRAMQQILGLHRQLRSWDRRYLVTQDDGLVSSCGDLIELVDDFYRPIHTSLQDYLTDPSNATADTAAFWSMQADHAAVLAETCLTFLNLEQLRVGPVDSEDHLDEIQQELPFLEYAIVGWARHLQELDANPRPELDALARSFLLRETTRELVLQAIFSLLPDFELPAWKDPFPFPGKSTPLHILALFGLNRLADTLEGSEKWLNHLDGFHMMPIDMALEFASRETTTWLMRRHEEAASISGLMYQVSPPGGYERVTQATWLDWDDVLEFLLRNGENREEFTKETPTPLFAAAEKGCTKSVEVLLRFSVNLEVSDSMQMTPLLVALDHGHPDVATALLNAGADVTKSTTRGFNAVHIAAKSGLSTLLPVLQAQNADFNKQDEKGITPLGWAIFNRQVDVAMELVQRYHANPQQRDFTAQNALHVAAISPLGSRASPLLQFLAQQQLDPHCAVDNGDTALHIAAGFPDKIEFVEAFDCLHPDVALCQNRRGQTPLHIAAFFGNAVVVRCLLSRPRAAQIASVKDHDGQTALHLAAHGGHLACVKLLATEGQLNQPGWYSMPPLSFAARNGHLATVAWLLDRGADIDMPSNKGGTPLMMAAWAGHSDTANLLLQRGADPRLKNKTKQTALHAAVSKNCLSTVQHILDAGHTDLVFARSEAGITPFMSSIASATQSVLELFLSRGLDGTYQSDSRGRSCLVGAALYGKQATFRQLKARRPDLVFAVDKLGYDLLQVVAGSGRVHLIHDVVRSGGLGVEGMGKGLYTPLHRAVIGASYTAVDVLLGLGADVHKRSGFPFLNQSIHFAANLPRMVQRLLEAGADPLSRNGLGLSAWDVSTPHVREHMALFGFQGPADIGGVGGDNKEAIARRTSICHADYVDATPRPDKAPEVIRALELLDMTTYSLLYLGRAFRHDGLALLVTMSILQDHSDMGKGINSLIMDYDAWEFRNTSGRFSRGQSPVSRFINVLKKMSQRPETFGTGTFAFAQSLQKELSALYDMHNDDRDMAFFECRDHHHVEVWPFSTGKFKNNKYFTNDGLLVNDFFTELVREYEKLLAEQDALPILSNQGLADPGQPHPSVSHIQSSSATAQPMAKPKEFVPNSPKLELASEDGDDEPEEPNVPNPLSTVHSSPAHELGERDKPQTHWRVEQGNYYSFLERNFEHVEASREVFLRLFTKTLEDHPTLEFYMLEASAGHPIQDKLGWQMLQVWFLGFVSRTLTEHFVSRKDASEEVETSSMTAEASQTVSDVAAAGNTNIEKINQDAVGDGQAVHPADLRTRIREELSIFVTRAAHPSDSQRRWQAIARQSDLEKGPDTTPLFDKQRMIFTAPFTLYDFYINHDIYPLIHRCRVSGQVPPIFPDGEDFDDQDK